MAVDKIWVGTTDNYETASNWLPSGIPIATDLVRFIQGSQSCLSNVDQSAVALGHVQVGGDYSGIIGTSSAPFKTGAITSFRYDGMRCRGMYFFPVSVAISHVLSTHPNGNPLVLTEGTHTILHAAKAQNLIVGGSAVVTLYEQGFSSSQATDVNVTFESGAALATMNINGGKVSCAADVAGGTINMYAGDWNHNGTSAFDIGTLNMLGGTARFFWDSLGGTIGTLLGIAGIFDGSGNGYEKTITTATGWTGFTLNLANGVGTITLTNPLISKGQPRLILDTDRDLTAQSVLA